jgi:hypothetical protein
MVLHAAESAGLVRAGVVLVVARRPSTFHPGLAPNYRPAITHRSGNLRAAD